jgi:RNA polymerase sigma-70 factor (ECF subfamily)
VAYRENELIKLAQSGDRDAFCEVASLYARKLYILALYFTRNRHDAEDLSQEVWLRAYRALGSFKHESSFYTWLRQITINTFLNDRRQSRLAMESELDEADIEHGFEEAIHNQILAEKVYEALGNLTPRQRLMLLLKHREGLTYEEIANAMGCSVGTVKKSLFRAVMKLREHLQANAVGVSSSEADTRR